MDQYELYDSIFKRKSVRKYDSRPLDEETMAKVKAFMSSLKPLLPGIRTELRILGGDEVKGMFKVDAPHFLAIFSEEKEGHLANAGFMLQQMDLFFSANGIGCCWQGGPKVTRKVAEDSELNFIISLAFGKPAEDVHRRGVSEFKRRPLQKITNMKGMEELMEPVRLAPSGMNNQPWYYTDGDGTINAFSAKSMAVDKMNLISTGISLCHLWLSATHSGKRTEFMIVRSKAESSPKRYIYVASMAMK